MSNLPLLLTINILVWVALLVYSLRLIPALARRWRLWGVLAGLVAAAALSTFSYQYAARQQVKKRVDDHYITGLDEKQRGNLDEAQREFERALALQPGNPEVKRQLEEIQQQKPAEQRVSQRDARIDPTAKPPAPRPDPSAPNAPNAPSTPAGSAVPPKPKPLAHKQSPFEITHYALDVDLDPKAHTLGATATIRVRSRGGTLNTLDFSLRPEFKPSLVLVNEAPAQFRHTNDLLAVTTPRPLTPADEAVVTVRYRRTGKAVIAGGLGLIAEAGTYFLSEARWYPATGELDFRSPVRVRAKVPKGYSVVSVGELKSTEKDEKSVTYVWETKRYASMVSLAAAKYVQQSVRVPLASGAGGRGDLKITCYTFPKHRDRAAAFLKEAAAITRFYEKHLGPYPYEKLGVVEIPLFPGGYGTTSFVMLLDQSFAEKKVDREFLAHEIAHQWWGNSVFPQGLGAAWLTEAFSNYSAWMYEASITGNPRILHKRVARGVQEYFEETEKKGDQAIYETDPYQPIGATEKILYEKGAVILHMLRLQIGDKAFIRTLRAFADDHRFKLAKIEDFRRIAERESGQQLGWFFDQWLGREGGMALAYNFETEPDTPTQNRAVLRVTQKAPSYRARVKVVLQVDNNVVTREIELSKEHEEFTFPVKGKVTSVLFDPESAYLMRRPQWVVPGEKQAGR